jgi:hypothetical protein
VRSVAAKIAEDLDRLQEHNMIAGWRRVTQDVGNARWFIECGGTWGPYTQTQAIAFVDGCTAMGAG